MSTKDSRKEGNTAAVRRLGHDLAEARRLAPLMADPLLNAIRVERLRASITRWLWMFLVCGLGYTTPGVQEFLAVGRTMADPTWWAAWLVEPAFGGILVTLLRWEAEMLARGVEITARAATILKRTLLTATLFMNVYPTIHRPEGEPFSLGSMFVHAVIPLIVFFLAEVMPVVQQTCAAAKHPPAAPAPAVDPVVEVGIDDTPAASTEPPAPAPPLIEAAPPPSPTTPVPRLPPAVLATIRQRLAAARAEGRAPTTADVTGVVDLPADTAARLLADLAA
ncbi:hypothetical protein [Actinokineospora pegani]|uniref:hypothetical protein n=1 Tax=Actinokineospora pegani TaxID=2654637 RepID=UPI0012EA8783|nr:hypothetical protein [Actinokineospora pegani]